MKQNIILNQENDIDPQDLSRSLIREFLIKNNLTKTLDVFNGEDNRQRVKMTKLDLIKYLSIERLVINNKNAKVQ